MGDTLTPAASPVPRQALPASEGEAQVLCGLFPISRRDDLSARATGKLRLNDASCSTNRKAPALGFGFRCGFLGMLHMEIIQERLEREYDLISSPPHRPWCTRSS